jgi:hypothetical protein
MATPSGRCRRNQPDIILFTEMERAYSIGRELGTLLFSAKKTIKPHIRCRAGGSASRKSLSRSISRTRHSVFGRSGRSAIWPCWRRARDRFRCRTRLFSRCSGFRQCVLTSRWILSRRAKHPQGATCERLFVVEHQAIEWGDMGATASRRVYSTCSLKQSLISMKWVLIFRKNHVPSIS